ncbi:putative transferase [Chloropicon primus]|uniref:Putative transferase n=1 Tax=Chloropicon primus TaxID=1764295 RepID=A0A5B8MMG6_9CHLO|nr:putative transferase [Chloropicon primus]UPR00438.1 putative transferase [Chloropicon primus]|eukprot:QDZ21224.1 putative transferase [Chloropicon primus]
MSSSSYSYSYSYSYSSSSAGEEEEKEGGNALKGMERLSMRSVVELRGEDRYTFLQGLVTNDVDELEKETSAKKCMYSLLLNHKGRFMHDLFLYNVGRGGSLLMDVHKPSLDLVMKVLKRYKLRSKVDVEDVSDKYCVLYSTSEDDLVGLPNSVAFKDPRHELLGYRCLVQESAGALPPHLARGSPDKHTALRYSLGVPEGDKEMPSGKAIPLEYNIDVLNGISYTKGCYMGQELTARTHFQGLVRKRLVPAKIVADKEVLARISEHLLGEGAEEENPLEVVDTTKRKTRGGKGIGTLLGIHGNRGLALLRLKDLAGRTYGLRLKGDAQQTFEAQVEPHLPDWWPKDWYASAQDTV